MNRKRLDKEPFSGIMKGDENTKSTIRSTFKIDAPVFHIRKDWTAFTFSVPHQLRGSF